MTLVSLSYTSIAVFSVGYLVKSWLLGCTFVSPSPIASPYFSASSRMFRDCVHAITVRPSVCGLVLHLVSPLASPSIASSHHSIKSSMLSVLSNYSVLPAIII